MAIETVRNRILTHLKERFLAIQEGVDGHVVTWNVVERRVLTDEEQRMGNALALLDVSEEKRAEVGFMRSDLKLATEFWIRLELGDDASERINEVMGDVQLTIGADINATVSLSPLCQLTISMTETSNEIDIEGAADDLVGGVIMWSILYRHKDGDPTKLPGE